MVQKVLIVASEGVDDNELAGLIAGFEEKGLAAEIAAPEKGPFKGSGGETFHANMTVNEGLAAAGDFQALVLPGGKPSERLSRDKDAVKLVGLFNELGKTIGAVCHGCDLMLRGMDPHGRRIAAMPEEYRNTWGAQATWVDEPVFKDGNLVTAKGAGDLSRFVDSVVESM
jgi:protease I